MKLTAPIGNSQTLSAFLLLLGAIGVACASLSFQHIGGFQPCKLCYIQREIHYSMIPFTAITLFAIWRGWSALIIRLLFLIMLAILLYGAGVGVYQAGAEWDFWLGPNDCTEAVDIAKDAGNLLSQLQSTKLVSCTEAQLRILGLSFAGWNVVLSSVLILIALGGALLGRDALAPLFDRLPVLTNLVTKITGA